MQGRFRKGAYGLIGSEVILVADEVSYLSDGGDIIGILILLDKAEDVSSRSAYEALEYLLVAGNTQRGIMVIMKRTHRDITVTLLDYLNVVSDDIFYGCLVPDVVNDLFRYSCHQIPPRIQSSFQ